MKKEVENLIIYKQLLEMTYYTENICEKYPKNEKLAIVTSIKNTTYDCIKNVIYAFKMYDKSLKLNYLNKLDVDLKFLKVLVRLSYRRKYINKRNYTAWSKKITNVGNLLGGWISSCAKV